MRIGGLASGLDIDSMVRDLMKAERAPLDRLFQQKQKVEWQRDAYREVNLGLMSFRSETNNLRFQSTFKAYDVQSTHSSLVTASATGDAAPGTYSVEVHEMAKVAKLTSMNAVQQNGQAVTGSDKVLAEGETQTFQLSNEQGQTADITVTDEDTYTSLARKIAQATDADGQSLGVRASFDDTTSHFFFSTKEQGGNQGFTFEDTAFVREHIFGAQPEETPQLSATGQYGHITFDGVEINDLTSNQVSVNGLNLNLHQADPSQVATLTVERDTNSVVESIRGFVDQYNEFITDIETKLREPQYRDFPPLTDEQRQAMSEREQEQWDEKAQSGLLRNDASLRNALTSFRRALSDPVQGMNEGEIKQLSEIGITTGDYREGGRLHIDEGKLREALTDRPEEVMNLFTKNGDSSETSGLGRRLNEEINILNDRLTQKAGSQGITAGDQSTLGRNIDRIDNQMQRWENRLVEIEDRYWRQFTAMERAINQANAQSAWMTENMFGGV
ncbi:flagellar filament capping protein FliD [Caldalkalibacillus salinus]|uniref:flagellar filament capping protein FliD n=1 Tax=Caldalkalibacillus salinus TaxID=2803787 RepID=UPI00192342F6|nr:flagellar filament capping protein FliD [Caldalkalibacillus salinus]